MPESSQQATTSCTVRKLGKNTTSKGQSDEKPPKKVRGGAAKGCT